MAQKKFYVYCLCYPDGTVFYVGKGSSNRLYNHEETARGGSKTATSNVIREIWASGHNVQKKILFESENEAEALAEEQRQIALYDNGKLTNRALRSRHVEWINHQPHKRYTEARVVDFPADSNWKEVWNEIRAIAIMRQTTIGAIVLQAMREYLEYEKEKSEVA